MGDGRDKRQWAEVMLLLLKCAQATRIPRCAVTAPTRILKQLEWAIWWKSASLMSMHFLFIKSKHAFGDKSIKNSNLHYVITVFIIWKSSFEIPGTCVWDKSGYWIIKLNYTGTGTNMPTPHKKGLCWPGHLWTWACEATTNEPLAARLDKFLAGNALSKSKHTLIMQDTDVKKNANPFIFNNNNN